MRKNPYYYVITILLGIILQSASVFASGTQVSMIRFYNFNEGSGTIAHDEVISNDGVFGSGKTQADWVVGKYDGGLEFNGIRLRDYPPAPGPDGPQYDVVDCGLLDLSNRGTVMAWIKQDSGPAVDYTNNANWFMVNGTNDLGFQFIFYNQPSQGFNLSIELQLQAGGNTALHTATPIPVDTWIHVAASWDSTLNKKSLYVNGVEVATDTFSGPLNQTTGHLNIGGDPFWTYNGRGFDGTIDEVRIFDGFLDAASVQSYMNSVVSPTITCGDEFHPYPQGDITQDCYVDFQDILVLANQWLLNDCADPNWCNDADFDKDGKIGGLDFAVLSRHWKECTSPLPPCNYMAAAAVPGGYNHDFKNGLDGWLVSNNAFQATHQNNGLLPWKGSYYLWASEKYATSDDGNATGILRSANFDITTVDALTFWIAGVDGSGQTPLGLNYVRLMRNNDNVELFKTLCPQDAAWQRVVWDIAPFVGSNVRLEVVDGNPDPVNGWIAVGDFEAGNDAVLSPWMPVQAGTDTIYCWGRQYQWGTSLMPTQVITQGQSLLVSPIELKMRVSNQLVAWVPSGTQGSPILTSDSGVAANIKRTVQGSGVRVSSNTTVEFDGMMRIDLTISPVAGPVNVTNFWIEIPFTTQASKLMYLWYQPWYGERTTGATATYNGAFHPMCWLGNEKGGLSWFAESDEGWLPAGNSSAIQISPGSNSTLLKINIWSTSHTLTGAEHFTMGFQADPVKPMPADWHSQSIVGNVEWYGSDGSSALQTLSDYRVETISSGEDWAAIQNYPEAWCGRDGSVVQKIWYPAALPVNTWTHIAVTWDVNTSTARLYKDGVLKSHIMNFVPLTSPYFGSFAIGGDPGVNQDRQFGGVMDELRIYNRALSLTEIQQAMNSVIPLGPSGIMHAYNFESVSGSIVYDQIGSINGVFGSGKMSSDWTSNGKYGGGLMFFGTDLNGNDYVEFGNAPSFSLATSGTIMAWIKETTQDSGSFIWQRRGLGDPASYRLISEGAPANKWSLELLTGPEYCSCENPANDDYGAIVDQVHQYGLKTIPYFGFLIADIAPEWPQYGETFRKLNDAEIQPYSVYKREASGGRPAQIDRGVCYQSGYADLILDGMILVKNKYNIDGVYLDATQLPGKCYNKSHGCGYDQSTSVIPTYPIFSHRSMMKRMNAIFVQDGGLIEAHTNMCVFPPIVSFVTSMLDGEWFYTLGDPGQPVLSYASLDSYRAHFGNHWGVGTRFLDPTPDPFNEEQLMSVCLLQDVFMRPSNGRGYAQIERIMPWLNEFADFGADNAAWFGYWDNAAYVTTSNTNMKCSFFARTDNNTLLLIVSNFGSNDISNASVTINLQSLGMSPVTHGTMWIYGASSQTVPVSNGTVTLGLLPRETPRMILLQP